MSVKNRFSAIGVPSFPMAELFVFWGGIQGGFHAFKHNPENYAKDITCPVLFKYGERGPKVTRQETDDIYNNLAEPKKLVIFPLAGHENYLLQYQPEWVSAIKKFLRIY